MEGAELSFDLVPGHDVCRICLGSLYRDLNPVRSRESEITLDDRAGKIVDFFECVCPPIVEIGLPMPGGMTTRTGCAKDVKLRVRCPLVFLHIASVFTVGGPEIFEGENVIAHVMNFDPRFIERRTMFSDRGHASSQFLIWRSDARAFPLRLMSASQQGSRDQEGKEDAHTELQPHDGRAEAGKQ